MKKRLTISLVLILVLICSGCHQTPAPQAAAQKAAASASYSLRDIPAYAGEPFVALEKNQPRFSEEDKSTISYEAYSTLDSLGRCGPATACIGKDLMPTEKRGEIGQVKPTGWQVAKYDFVDGKYLYNRCHLIGFQLSGENANKKNLITGTRYLNVQGMLPFENMVADYVKETGNHVLYRVTPIFAGENLLASGVEMEGQSVEDGGEEICFHVFCYNVQPGVVIDYKTGANKAEGAKEAAYYVLNANSKKFHLPDCESVEQIAGKNRKIYRGEREKLIAQGYSPCANCHP